jgi:hypothetical protein
MLMASTVETGAEGQGNQAFSDGVFALQSRCWSQPAGWSERGQSLLRVGEPVARLLRFCDGFMTILIMWVGHHEMFTHQRADRRFMFLNGFLLFRDMTPFTRPSWQTASG